MDTCNEINLNKNKFKIVNLIKYLVLIFAFLFVGVVGASEKVCAEDEEVLQRLGKPDESSINETLLYLYNTRLYSKVETRQTDGFMQISFDHEVINVMSQLDRYSYYNYKIVGYAYQVCNYGVTSCNNIFEFKSVNSSHGTSFVVHQDGVTSFRYKTGWGNNYKKYWQDHDEATLVSDYLSNLKSAVPNYNETGYHLAIVYEIAEYVTPTWGGPDAETIDRYLYIYGFDIPKYYHSTPTVEVKVDNDIYSKSHTVTLNYKVPHVVSICYDWSTRAASLSSQLKNCTQMDSPITTFTKSNGYGKYYFNFSLTYSVVESSLSNIFSWDTNSPNVGIYMDNAAPYKVSYSPNGDDDFLNRVSDNYEPSVDVEYSDVSGVKKIYGQWIFTDLSYGSFNVGDVVERDGDYANIPFPSDLNVTSGSYFLRTWAEDYLGNNGGSSVTSPFYIDRSAVEIDVKDSSGNAYSIDVASGHKMNLVFSDEGIYGSGIKHYGYCFSTININDSSDHFANNVAFSDIYNNLKYCGYVGENPASNFQNKVKFNEVKNITGVSSKIEKTIYVCADKEDVEDTKCLDNGDEQYNFYLDYKDDAGNLIEWYLVSYAVDRVGNVTYKSSEAIMIDIDAPSVNFEVLSYKKENVVDGNKVSFPSNGADKLYGNILRAAIILPENNDVVSFKYSWMLSTSFPDRAAIVSEYGYNIEMKNGNFERKLWENAAGDNVESLFYYADTYNEGLDDNEYLLCVSAKDRAGNEGLNCINNLIVDNEDIKIKQIDTTKIFNEGKEIGYVDSDQVVVKKEDGKELYYRENYVIRSQFELEDVNLFTKEMVDNKENSNSSEGDLVALPLRKIIFFDSNLDTDEEGNVVVVERLYSENSSNNIVEIVVKSGSFEGCKYNLYVEYYDYSDVSSTESDKYVMTLDITGCSAANGEIVVNLKNTAFIDIADNPLFLGNNVSKYQLISLKIDNEPIEITNTDKYVISPNKKIDYNNEDISYDNDEEGYANSGNYIAKQLFLEDENIDEISIIGENYTKSNIYFTLKNEEGEIDNDYCKYDFSIAFDGVVNLGNTNKYILTIVLYDCGFDGKDSNVEVYLKNTAVHDKAGNVLDLSTLEGEEDITGVEEVKLFSFVLDNSQIHVYFNGATKRYINKDSSISAKIHVIATNLNEELYVVDKAPTDFVEVSGSSPLDFVGEYEGCKYIYYVTKDSKSVSGYDYYINVEVKECSNKNSDTGSLKVYLREDSLKDNANNNINLDKYDGKLLIIDVVVDNKNPYLTQSTSDKVIVNTNEDGSGASYDGGYFNGSLYVRKVFYLSENNFNYDSHFSKFMNDDVDSEGKEIIFIDYVTSDEFVTISSSESNTLTGCKYYIEFIEENNGLYTLVFVLTGCSAEVEDVTLSVKLKDGAFADLAGNESTAIDLFSIKLDNVQDVPKFEFVDSKTYYGTGDTIQVKATFERGFMLKPGSGLAEYSFPTLQYMVKNTKCPDKADELSGLDICEVGYILNAVQKGNSLIYTYEVSNTKIEQLTFIWVGYGSSVPYNAMVDIAGNLPSTSAKNELSVDGINEKSLGITGLYAKVYLDNNYAKEFNVNGTGSLKINDKMKVRFIVAFTVYQGIYNDVSESYGLDISKISGINPGYCSIGDSSEEKISDDGTWKITQYVNCSKIEAYSNDNTNSSIKSVTSSSNVETVEVIFSDDFVKRYNAPSGSTKSFKLSFEINNTVPDLFTGSYSAINGSVSINETSAFYMYDSDTSSFKSVSGCSLISYGDCSDSGNSIVLTNLTNETNTINIVSGLYNEYGVSPERKSFSVDNANASDVSVEERISDSIDIKDYLEKKSVSVNGSKLIYTYTYLVEASEVSATSSTKFAYMFVVTGGKFTGYKEGDKEVTGITNNTVVAKNYGLSSLVNSDSLTLKYVIKLDNGIDVEIIISVIKYDSSASLSITMGDNSSNEVEYTLDNFMNVNLSFSIKIIDQTSYNGAFLSEFNATNMDVNSIDNSIKDKVKGSVNVTIAFSDVNIYSKVINTQISFNSITGEMVYKEGKITLYSEAPVYIPVKAKPLNDTDNTLIPDSNVLWADGTTQDYYKYDYVGNNTFKVSLNKDNYHTPVYFKKKIKDVEVTYESGSAKDNPVVFVYNDVSNNKITIDGITFEYVSNYVKPVIEISDASGPYVVSSDGSCSTTSVTSLQMGDSMCYTFTVTKTSDTSALTIDHNKVIGSSAYFSSPFVTASYVNNTHIITMTFTYENDNMSTKHKSTKFQITLSKDFVTDSATLILGSNKVVTVDEIDLIPVEFDGKFDVSVDGTKVNGYYKGNYEVTLDFSKDLDKNSLLVDEDDNIKALRMYVDGVNDSDFTCKLYDGDTIKCSSPASLLNTEGKYNIKLISTSSSVGGTIKYNSIKDVDGLTVVYEEAKNIDTISYDDVAPSLSVSGSGSGTYGTSSTFTVSLTAEFDDSDISGIDVNSFSVDVSVDKCDVVSFNKSTGDLKLTNCAANTGEIVVKYNASVRDNALNIGILNEKVTLGDITIVNGNGGITLESDTSSPTDTEYMKSGDIKTFEFTASGNIGEDGLILNCKEIEVSSYVEIVAGSCKTIVDDNINKVVLTVKAINSNSTEKNIVIIFGSGAISSVKDGITYTYSGDEFEYSNIEIITDGVNISYNSITHTGCESFNGKYYCNVGDSIVITFVADKEVISSGDTLITLKLNGTEMSPITGVLKATDKKTITFTYTIGNDENGSLGFVSTDFKYKDIAGNIAGVDSTSFNRLSTEINSYIIDTKLIGDEVTHASFTSDGAVVDDEGNDRYIGQSFDDYLKSMLDKYALSVNLTKSIKELASDNVLEGWKAFDRNTLVDGKFSVTGTNYCFVLTVEDRAKNSASLYIIMDVKMSADIIVTFANVEKIFDGLYDSNPLKKFTIEFNSSYINDLEASRINEGKKTLKQALTEKIVGIFTDQDGNKIDSPINVGQYFITYGDSITISGEKDASLNGTYSLTVINGSYKITVADIMVDFNEHCVEYIPENLTNVTYDKNNLYHTYSGYFNCYVKDSRIGESSDERGYEVRFKGTLSFKTYNVSDESEYIVKVTDDKLIESANDPDTEFVLGFSEGVGVGKILPYEIDLNGYVFEDITKLADSSTEIKQSSAIYESDIGDLEIGWDSGCSGYVNATAIGKTEIKLCGTYIKRTSDNDLASNYKLINKITDEDKEYIIAYGYLTNENNFDVDVEYYFDINTKLEYDGIIYTNKDVTFVITGYNTEIKDKTLFTKEWVFCPESGDCRQAETGKTAEYEKYVVSESGTLTLTVTSPGGVSSVKVMEVVVNNNPIKLQSIEVAADGFTLDKLSSGNDWELSTTTKTYTNGETIYFVLDFDRTIKTGTPPSILRVSGATGNYNFTLKGQVADKVVYSYTIPSNISSDSNLRVDDESISMLVGSIEDEYGNVFSISGNQGVSFGYTINIEIASAEITGVRFELVDSSGNDIKDIIYENNTYYVSTARLSNSSSAVYLKVTITFKESGTISNIPASIYLNNDKIEIAYLSNGSNNVIFRGKLNGADIDEGVMAISGFKGSSTISVNNKLLELDSSINASRSNLVSVYYDDGTSINAFLPSGRLIVKDEVEIEYSFSKNGNLINVTKDNLSMHYCAWDRVNDDDKGVVDCGSKVDLDEKVIVEITNDKIKITGLSGTRALRIMESTTNPIKDYYGTNVNWDKFYVYVDNTPVKTTSIEVTSDGCSSEGNEGNICGKGKTLTATVYFSKPIQTPNSEIKLKTTNSNIVFDYSSYSSNGNYVKFTYTVLANNLDYTLKFASLSLSVKDLINNDLDTLLVDSVPVSGVYMIDTIKPVLDKQNIVSEGVGCSDSGYCNSSSKISIKLPFNEIVVKYSALELYTTFGDLKVKDETPVTAENLYVDIDVKVAANSFEIKGIKGRFFDRAGNELVLDINNTSEEIHKNEDLKSDFTVATISSVAINDVTSSSDYLYFKGTNTFTIKFTFSEPVKFNIKPSLSLTFDNNSHKGSYTSSTGNDYIEYTYTVSTGDAGELTSISLVNGNVVDLANNSVDLNYMPEGYYKKVRIDNEQLKIGFVYRDDMVDGTTATIPYICNKSSDYVDCTLSGVVTGKFSVKKNGVALEGISINATVNEQYGKVIVISGLTNIDGNITVQANAGIMTDYVGNLNVLNEPFTIGVDTTSIDIAYYQRIEIDVSECANNICTIGDTIRIKIPFTKYISKVSSDTKLMIKIGDGDAKYTEEEKVYYSSSSNIMTFDYTIVDADDGIGITILGIEGLITPVSGNTNERNENDLDIKVSSTYQNYGLNVDTKAPEYPSITSISASDGCDDGICNVGDKILVRLTFSEKISSYSGVVIETNFGNYRKTEITNNNLTHIEFVIDVTKANSVEDSFVIDRIEGIFYDQVAKYLEINKTNDTEDIHVNTELKLDSASPVVESIVVGCEENVSSCSLNDGREIVVTVTFSELLANAYLSTNNISELSLKFNKVEGKGRSEPSNVETNSEGTKTVITYIYTVHEDDDGELDSVSLSGGNLRDSNYNNAKYEELPLFSGDSIIVDNVAPNISNIVIDKGNEEEGISSKYLNDGDSVKVTVSFDDYINGDEITLVVNVGGNEKTATVENINNRMTVEFIYPVTSDDNGLIVPVSISGEKVKDSTGNPAELNLDKHEGNELVIINDGYNLSATQDKAIVSGEELEAGNVIIYSVSGGNEYSFEDVVSKISEHLALTCSVVYYDGESYSGECEDVGVSVELGGSIEGTKYNIFLKKKDNADLSGDVLANLTLEYGGTSLVDLAGNTIEFVINDNVVVYDNMTREVSSFEITSSTNEKINNEYYITQDMEITVTVVFNGMLSDSIMFIGSKVKVVLKDGNDAIVAIVDLTTEDGITYSGSYVFDDLSSIIEGRLKATICSKSGSKPFNNYVTASNGVKQYDIYTSKNTNLYYDNSVPEVSLSHAHVKNYVKDTLVFKLKCEDILSGCSGDYEVKINGNEISSSKVENEYTVYEVNLGTIASGESVIVSYSGYDKVNNKSSSKEELFVVDSVGPSIVVDLKSNSIVGEGTSVKVKVSDVLSGLATKHGTVYKWEGFNEEFVSLDLDNDGVGAIAVPNVHGTYRLIVKGSVDNVGNVNSVGTSISDVLVDIEAPIIEDVVITPASSSADKICSKYDDDIYCGINGSLNVTLIVSDDSKIDYSNYEITSDDFDVLRGSVLIEEGKYKISFRLRVKSETITNKENMNIGVSISDVLGNGLVGHSEPLDGVVIDVNDDVIFDFNDPEHFKLHYGDNREGEYIDTLWYEESGSVRAPLNVTYTLIYSDGHKEEFDDAEEVKRYVRNEKNRFIDDTTLVIKFEDCAGNGREEEYIIEIDNADPEFSYLVKENNVTINNKYVLDKDNLYVEIVYLSEDVTYKAICKNSSDEKISCIDEVNGDLPADSGENILNASSIALNPRSFKINMGDSSYVKIVITVTDLAQNPIEKAIELRYIEANVTSSSAEEGYKQSHNIKLDENTFGLIGNTFTSQVIKSVTYKLKKEGYDYTPVRYFENSDVTINGNSLSIYGGDGEYSLVIEVLFRDGRSKVINSDFKLKFDNNISVGNISYTSEGTTFDYFNWSKASVVIEIGKVDDLSGISEVRVVGGDEVKYCLETEDKYSCEVNKYGSYTVKVTDVAGNEESIIQNQLIKIDTFGFEIDTVEYSDEYAKEHNVSFNFEDEDSPKELSGFDMVRWMIVPSSVNIEGDFYKFYYENISKYNQGSSDNKYNLTLNNLKEENGVYNLYVYISDKAGNFALETKTLYFDNLGPTITVNGKLTEDIRKLEIIDKELVDTTDSSNQFVVFSVDDYREGKKVVNGVKSISYKITKGNEVVCDSEGTCNLAYLEGEYTLVITSLDVLGNESEKVVEKVLIDNVGPTVIWENKGWNTNPTFKIEDGLSGLEEEAVVKYCAYVGLECDEYNEVKLDENNSFVANIDSENGTVIVKIIVSDKLGNVKTEYAPIDYDDKAPVIEIESVTPMSGIGTLGVAKHEVNDEYYVTGYTNVGINVSFIIRDDNIGDNKGIIKVCFAKEVSNRNAIDFDLCSLREVTYDEEKDEYRLEYNDIVTYGYIGVYVKDMIGNETKLYLNVREGTISSSKSYFELIYSSAISTSQVIDVEFTSDIEDVTSLTYKVCENSEGKECSEPIDVDLETLSVEVNVNDNNKVYIFTSTNKWGVTYEQSVEIKNIDNSKPSFVDEEDFKLVSSSDQVVLTGDSYDKVDSVGVLLNGSKFIYNKGSLGIHIPAGSMYDPSVEGATLERNIFVDFCIDNLVCITSAPVGLDMNGYSIETSIYLKPENFGLEMFNNTIIKYRISDSAGNYMNEEDRSFTVSQQKENISTVTFSHDTITGWVNGFKVSYTKGDNAIFISDVYVYLDSNGSALCEQKVDSGVEVDVVCEARQLDGEYAIGYRMIDVFGYEKSDVVVDRVQIDNVAPSNSDDLINLNLYKENEDSYYVVYNNYNNKEKALEILYLVDEENSTYERYCLIENSESSCGILDSNYFVDNKINLYTRVIDKAGNLSTIVASEKYQLVYNNSRRVELRNTTYNASEKVITVEFNVVSPTGGVKVVEIYDAQDNLIVNLEDTVELGKVSNTNRYKVFISSSNKFRSLFGDGKINTSIFIKVFDEDTNTAIGGAVGQIGEPIEVSLDYDTNDPSITISGEDIISTREENIYKVNVANKDKDSYIIDYILQRTSNNSYNTITVDNFKEESNLVNCSACVAANPIVNNEITVSKDTNLNGIYRLIVYVEDDEGNRNITSKVIKIDNASAEFSMLGISTRYDTGREDLLEGYKVYNENVKVSVRDVSVNSFSSGVASLYVENVNSPSINQTYTSNLESLEVLFGGSNRFGDGKYRLLVTDNVGNQNEVYICIDTDNSGFNVIDEEGNSVNIEERYFNEESFRKLNLKYAEDMYSVTFKFKEGTADKVTINVISGIGGLTCKYYLNTNQSNSKSCNTGWESYIKFGADEIISIDDMMSMVETTSVDKSKLNKVEIITYNISNIKSEQTIKLDFKVDGFVPVSRLENIPLVADSVRIVNSLGDSVVSCKANDGSVLCSIREHTTKVIASGSDYASKIKSLLETFIYRVDNKSFASAVEDGNLTLEYFNVDNSDSVVELDVRMDGWQYDVENVLDVVGDYVFKYSYSDMAGNEVKPIYLLLHVEDTVVPVISNVNKINTSNIVYIDGSDRNTYTVLSIKATDNYGFSNGEKEITSFDHTLLYISKSGRTDEELIEFREEGNVSVGYVNGVKYLIRTPNGDGSVKYTFIRQATYSLTYQVKDASMNDSKSFISTITVYDKHAPEMREDNTISIADNYFVIDGVRYLLQEDETGMWLESELQEKINISSKMFEIEGKTYELDINNNLVYPVLNYNNGMLCFGEASEGCGVIFNKIQSYDYEDDKYMNVYLDVNKLQYSSNGSKFTSTQMYELDDKVEESELFKLRSIKFKLIGYYKIVFYSIDSRYSSDNRTNLSEVTYIVKVVDTQAPWFEFVKDNSEVGETDLGKIEYDEDFAQLIKGNQYKGATEEEKIASYIKKWVEDSIVSKDNYDTSIKYTIDEVSLTDDLDDYEYLKYRVVLRAQDNSNNVSVLRFTYTIRDTVSPLNGVIKVSYDQVKEVDLSGGFEIDTNSDNIYFKLSGASDATGKVTYEYKVIVDGYDMSDWVEFKSSSYELAYSSFVGETHSVQIGYRVKDRVGNISISDSNDGAIYTPLIRVDRQIPTIEVKLLDEEGAPLLEVDRYDGIGQVGIVFRDDKGYMKVEGYRNNNLILSKESLVGNTRMDYAGFGHYKFVARDPAGNIITREFVIIPSDNNYVAIGNDSLGDALNASDINMKFDTVILQKLSDDGNSFYFEDMSLIGDNDSVYIMGVVPNKEGAIFSIYPSGAIKGSVFKNSYATLCPINISSNITGIDPNYTLTDYIINMNGEKYVLVGIEKGTYVGGNEEDNNNVNTPENNNNGGGADFTWVLYTLGGIGAIGGVFLIMKLRKRVRAA